MLRKTPTGVVIVSCVMALALLGDAALYAVLPSNVEDFGVPIALVGILLSANRFIRIVSNGWAAMIYSRMGYRMPLMVAVVASVASTIVYGVARNFFPLLLARLAWGVSFSFLRLGGYLVVLEDGDPSDRGRLMGFFNAVHRSGNLVGVVIGAALADIFGHLIMFLLFAVIGTMGLPIVMWHWRSTKKNVQPLKSHPDTLSTNAADKTVNCSTEDSKKTNNSQARRKLAAVGFLRFAQAFSVSGLVMATLGLYLRNLGGDNILLFGNTIGIATVTGMMLGARWAFSLGLATSLGSISDRAGRPTVIPVFAFVVSICLAALAFSPGLIWVGLVLIPLFLASVGSEIALDASIGDISSPGSRARALGWYTTWADMGMAIGPVTGYWVGATMGLPSLYLVASGLIVVGLLTYLLVFRGR